MPGRWVVVRAGCPADHTPRERGKDDGEIQPALVRIRVRHVGDPGRIRKLDVEVAVEHVRCDRVHVIRVGCFPKSRNPPFPWPMATPTPMTRARNRTQLKTGRRDGPHSSPQRLSKSDPRSSWPEQWRSHSDFATPPDFEQEHGREAGAALGVAKHSRVGYQLGVLEYVAASLFESPAQTLVNTVNTAGVMGKGIANDFRRLYPNMFEKYQAFCAEGKFGVGQLYLYRTPHKWVLNFPTKQHWRNPSRMEWIEAGLEKFLETYSQYGITSVAFPQLGTGNGGLSWDDVRPVMEKYLKQVRVPVYIHVRPRDPKFVPEHLRSGEVPALSRELHAARIDVTFEKFVNDVREVFHAQVKEPQDLEELPGLEMRIRDGSPFVIPGEQMLDFWQTLKLRGALELAALPHAVQETASSFAETLVTLDYIKPMQFGRDRRPGLRYAPPSLSHPPDAIDVNPE